MRLWLLPFVWSALFSAAAAHPMHAQAQADTASASSVLRRARRAYQGGALDSAAELYRAALTEGGHNPAELAEIHYRLGILLASMGQSPERDFELALAIDPDLSPPVEVGPAIQELFSAIQRGYAQERMVLEIQAPDRAERGRSISIEVTLAHFPSSTPSRVRVRNADASVDMDTVVRGEMVSLALSADVWNEHTSLTLTVEALDSFGNVIAQRSLSIDGPASSDPGAADPSADETDITDEPAFWALLAAGIVLVTAGAIALGVAATAEPNYVIIVDFP